MGSVSDRHEAEVVELLGRDVMATLAGSHLDAIRSTAQSRRDFANARDLYVDQVVEDFQQYVHDMFIDTSWPKCPHHPNHPMWFRLGWWEADGRRVARLGELVGLLK